MVGRTQRRTVRALALPLLFVSVLGLGLLTLLGQSRPVLAQADFTVQTTQDSGQYTTADGVPPAVLGKCISNLAAYPPGGPCTLRAAIAAANELGGGPYTISVPAGNYNLSLGGLRLDGVDINLVGACCDGAGAPTTILDGLGLDAPLLTLCGQGCARATPTFSLSGIMLRNSGSAGLSNHCCGSLTLAHVAIVGNGTVESMGLVNGGTITATNLMVSGNVGGGMSNAGTFTGSLVTVKNNHSDPALYHPSGVGGIATGGTFTLTDAVVDSNSGGTGGNTGGILAQDAKVSLTRVTISNNTVDSAGSFYGGAGGLTATADPAYSITISLDTVHVTGNTLTGTLRSNDVGGINAHGTVTILNSTIDSNSGATGGIGLLENSTTLPSTLSGITITNNQGTIRPGGLYNSGGHLLTLSDSWITGNSTVSGNAAGLELNGASAGQVRVSRVTLSGNSGTGPALYLGEQVDTQLTNLTLSHNSGGGMTIQVYSSTPVQLTNLTIAFNGAPGGVRFTPDRGYSNFQFKNNLIADNTTANCIDAVPSQGSNLEGNDAGVAGTGSGASCGFSAAGDREHQTPLLGPLANNGGPTLTHALQSGSPAIDGVIGGCPPPATDQRGISRPQGPRCDIGAFESTSAAAAAPAVTSLNRSSGPAAGGAGVTITGTNFSPIGANNTVKFGTATATVQSCNAAGTQCTVLSPAGTAGVTVHVTVTTNGLTSPTSAADQFTFVAPCTLATLSESPPGSATAGSSVTLTGGSSGCTTPLYEFWYYSAGAWHVLRGYSTTPTVTWDTKALGLGAGTYDLAVYVRSSPTSPDPETVRSIVYTLN